jgi:hypothetical protein
MVRVPRIAAARDAQPLMSSGNEPLSLERFAEISAELDTGDPRDEVLARAGLTVPEWLNIQQYWLGNISAEATRLRYELFHRYSKLFIEARRAAVARKAKKRQVLAPTSSRSEQVLMGQAVPEQREAAAPLQHGLGAGSQSGPRLSLAQWAALCAEIAVFANNADAIRERYGFDEPTFDRERAQWENLFGADRGVFDEYLSRFRHYRDWFLGAQAGG